MYFGNTKSSSEPSILQLTGQITLQMAHPTFLRNLHQYIPENLPFSYEHMRHSQHESHSQAVRQTPLREQLGNSSKQPPICQVNHIAQQNQQKHTQQNDRQAQGQNGKKRNGRQTLEERIEQLEQILEKSIKRVNLQTLETFGNLREELLHQITFHDQEYSQRVRNLEKIKNQWDKLFQKQENKFYYKKRELERVVNKKMENILKEERKESQNRQSDYFQKLHRHIEEQKTQTEERLEEINKDNEMLEEQLQLKVQEEVNRIQISIKETEERCQKQIKAIKNYLRKNQQAHNQINEKLNKIQKEAQQKGRAKKFGSLVDETRSSIYNFRIDNNRIIKLSQGFGCSVVLLDAVIEKKLFSFRTHFHKAQGDIFVGVTDKAARMNGEGDIQTKNSIGYSRYGSIRFGNGESDSSFSEGLVQISEGMEMVVEVKKAECLVTFIVGEKKRSIYTPILAQPNRQFVPFFSLTTKGDSVSWVLK